MMCTVELYKYQISQFSSDREVCFNGINEYADVTALAEAVLLNAPEKFALCGLSMGGIVAMEVQRIASERVLGIALLDTNPLAETIEVQAGRLPQIQKVQSGGLLEVMRDEMKPNYLADSEAKPAILDTCLAMALELGDDVFIKQSLALRERPDQTETLRNISVPSLVLCGEHDRLCPVERHQFMHELIAGSTLSVIEQAGHLPVLEQPDATNEHLSAWLTDCDNRAAS